MKIHVFQGVNQQWYFHIKGRNGKIIVPSEGYKTKQSCIKTAKLFNFEIKVL
jgi:uncharacterized protein YegP (UPF0339 family)